MKDPLESKVEGDVNSLEKAPKENLNINDFVPDSQMHLNFLELKTTPQFSHT